MKITGVRAFLLPRRPARSGWMTIKRLLLLKVETDEGIDGWGECYTLGQRETAAVALVQALGRAIVGTDPLDVVGFVQLAIAEVAERRPGIDLYCAASGIEIALWDIRGKRAGVPVYELLGAHRRALPLYLNCWSDTGPGIEAVIEKVQASIERGFSGVKMYPLLFGAELEVAAGAVERMREALGPDIRIMVDCGRRLDEASAIELADRLAGLDVFWMEEPVTSRDAVGLRNINARTALPLVTGESICGVDEFRTILELGCAEILNPDVAACGGIQELTAIAALADSYRAVVSPHNYNSMLVGLAASGHAALAMANLSVVEYFEDLDEAMTGFGCADHVVENGELHLGTSPGLGVQLDEHALGAEAEQTATVGPD